MSKFGTWHDWLCYFLNGIATQSADVLSRAERINALLDAWQIKAGGKSDKNIESIVKHFAVNPYFTTKEIVKRLNVAFTTAQRIISKLEHLGIISQTSEGKRDRVYCATQILDILEEPTKIT